MSATAPHADPIRQYLETARTQIAKGELRQAAETLNKAQKKSPNDARVFMLAGPEAFTAVTSVGLGLFAAWRSRSPRP